LGGVEELFPEGSGRGVLFGKGTQDGEGSAGMNEVCELLGGLDATAYENGIRREGTQGANGFEGGWGDSTTAGIHVK
jgi:hypothetical protein